MMMRSLHVTAVNKMLSTSSSGGGGSSQDGQWKVLIYDEFCRDTLMPLLASHRSLLRDHGITLRMLIKSKREPIPDAPALYFVQPTQENVMMIAQDCMKGLYESAYVHFCNAVPRPVFDVFAREIAKIPNQVGTASAAPLTPGTNIQVINKVCDHSLGFVTLEQSLFSLNVPNSFSNYNRPSLNQQDIESYIDNVVDGLLSSIVTLGSIPIIRCPKNGPSEMVARKLCAKLKEHLSQQDSSNELFSSSNRNPGISHMIEQRPVLLIVDRAIDLAIPLHHSSTYQTLIDDLLGIHLNKVSISAIVANTPDRAKEIVDSAAKRGDDKNYVLDPEIDSFWATYAGEQLPRAIEARKQGALELQGEKGKMLEHLGNSTKDLNEGAAASSIKGAMQALPEITEKKKWVELHGNLLESAWVPIRNRALPDYQELERRMIIYRQKTDKTRILPFLSDANKEYQDKVRLLAIYIFCMRPSSNEVAELETALDASIPPERAAIDKSGPFSKVIPFMKQTMSFSIPSKSGAASASTGASSGAAGRIWQNALGEVQDRLQGMAMSVTGGESSGTVAKTLDNISKAMPDDASTVDPASPAVDYLYLDPKVRAENVPYQARIRSEFKRGIVFMIGGGCYEEYHNILKAQRSADRELVYGCTEMMNASTFMKQMCESMPDR